MNLDRQARAEELHDKSWARYMKAWRKVRANPKSFRTQQAFIDASENLRLAQYRIANVQT